MLISGTVLAKLTLTQRNDFFLATSDLSIVERLANKAAFRSSLLSIPRTVHPQRSCGTNLYTGSTLTDGAP